jgi:hypothetical protein
VVADYTGCLRYPPLWAVATRNTLKGGVLFLFALTLAMDIRRPEDIRRHGVALAISLAIAFLIVLGCYLVPSWTGYWEVLERESLLARVGTAAQRAFGPLSGPGGVGAMACLMVPLGIALVAVRPLRLSLASLGVILMVLAAVGLIVSKSRQGFLGIGGMFGLMLLVSRRRWFVIVLGIVGVLAAMVLLSVYTETAGSLTERFTWSRLSRDLAIRAGLWATQVTDLVPAVLLCGEGWAATRVRLGESPHNAFIGALSIWGVGGVIMFSILVFASLRWSRFVSRHDPDAVSRALAWGIFWGVIAILFLSLVTDTWVKPEIRPIAFFVLVAFGMRYQSLRYAAAIDAGPHAAGLPEWGQGSRLEALKAGGDA